MIKKNSGKPLGSRGSAPNPAGGAHSAPRLPNWWGGSLLLPPQEPHPAIDFRFFVLGPATEKPGHALECRPTTSRRHLMQLLRRSWLAAVVETRSTDTINCLLSTYRYEFQSQRCHRTVGVASCQIAPRNRRKMAKFETETKCVAARRKNCSQLFSFA